MKRQVIAAAGTFVLAASSTVMANECKQIQSDAAMNCRVINAADLGPHFCFASEQIGLRGIKSNLQPADAWVTQKPIALGTVPARPNSSAGKCNHLPLGKTQLEVEQAGDKYRMKLSGDTNATVDLSVARDASGNDLWLSGADPAKPNVNYFVFFRDRSKSAANASTVDLPKFLIVEALDLNDAACKESAPSLQAATVSPGQCAAHGAGKPRDSGVGGGGEGGKNP